MHAFLARCADMLADGGRIAMVLSDRFLFNETAAPLREALGRNLSIQHVERLDPKTSFFRPKLRKAGTPPRIHPVAVIMGRGDGQRLTRAPIFPGADESKYAGLPTLGELATVRTGPWLGTQGIFLISEREAAESGIPGDVLVPAVSCEDIVEDGKGGHRLGRPVRFAMCTQPDRMPCKAVLRHLERTLHRMSDRGQAVGCAWMPPESFYRMDLSRESLMVPRILAAARAVRVPPGILPVNHDVNIVSSEPGILDKLERALNSQFATDWIRAFTPRLDNGFFSLNTRRARSMPIRLD